MVITVVNNTVLSAAILIRGSYTMKKSTDYLSGYCRGKRDAAHTMLFGQDHLRDDVAAEIKAMRRSHSRVNDSYC